jgi:hypothetical protein
MHDKDRKKIKLFIMAHGGGKTFTEAALDYFAKVVSCYLRCVADRLALLAEHAGRKTVEKRDLEIFYLVTSADCQDKKIGNIKNVNAEFSAGVVKHYTEDIIMRYSKNMHKIFSMIISEFVSQIIIRTDSDNVGVNEIKEVLRRYHLYNFLTKPICKDARVDVQ